MPQKTLILIVGPTAVGKTSLCVELAQYFNCEIFSCDSRQFYREMEIGTAKPTQEEMQNVKHHFIDNKSIHEPYNVGAFETEAIKGLETYFEQKNIAIMTGGSGLFAKAITHGLDELPATPSDIRESIKRELEEKGLEALYKELANFDPEYAQKVDSQNSQRVTRALEVIRHSGKRYSSFLNQPQKKRSFKIIKIGLELPREKLYNRINKRVDLMLENGLLAECENLREFAEHPALQTVGYAEAFQYFEQKINLDEMKELIKRNTRRYAKRQLTWFKNQDTFDWFKPTDKDQIIAYVESKF